jgi:hypothetical protein
VEGPWCPKGAGGTLEVYPLDAALYESNETLGGVNPTPWGDLASLHKMTKADDSLAL